MTASRSRVPPWPVVLSLLTVIGARVLNSLLAFERFSVWPVYVMQALMMGCLVGIWLFSKRAQSQDSGSPALRLAVLLALVYAVLIPVCDIVDPSSESYWLNCLPLLLQNFFLVYPLARLLTRLRADNTLPISLALAHAALFLFWALIIPATLQSLRQGSPSYLRWLQLAAPILSGAMISIHLSNRAALTRSRTHELAWLFLQNWHLPILFALGELAVIFVGVYTSG